MSHAFEPTAAEIGDPFAKMRAAQERHRQRFEPPKPKVYHDQPPGGDWHIVQRIMYRAAERAEEMKMAMEIEKRANGMAIDIIAKKDSEWKPLKLAEIMRFVCHMYETREIDMRSHRRTREMVYPRHIFMWYARKYTIKSLPEIGAYLKRDHTTIIHGFKKVQRMVKDGTFAPATEFQIRNTLGLEATPPVSGDTAARVHTTGAGE